MAEAPIKIKEVFDELKKSYGGHIELKFLNKRFCVFEASSSCLMLPAAECLRCQEPRQAFFQKRLSFFLKFPLVFNHFIVFKFQGLQPCFALFWLCRYYYAVIGYPSYVMGYLYRLFSFAVPFARGLKYAESFV